MLEGFHVSALWWANCTFFVQLQSIIMTSYWLDYFTVCVGCKPMTLLYVWVITAEQYPGHLCLDTLSGWLEGPASESDLF